MSGPHFLDVSFSYVFCSQQERDLHLFLFTVIRQKHRTKGGGATKFPVLDDAFV